MLLSAKIEKDYRFLYFLILLEVQGYYEIYPTLSLILINNM